MAASSLGAGPSSAAATVSTAPGAALRAVRADFADAHERRVRADAPADLETAASVKTIAVELTVEDNGDAVAAAGDAAALLAQAESRISEERRRAVAAEATRDEEQRRAVAEPRTVEKVLHGELLRILLERVALGARLGEHRAKIVGGGLLSLQPAVQSAARDEPFTWQCVSGQCGDAKCGKCSAAAAE